jgi:hypothetical protein
MQREKPDLAGISKAYASYKGHIRRRSFAQRYISRPGVFRPKRAGQTIVTPVFAIDDFCNAPTTGLPFRDENQQDLAFSGHSAAVKSLYSLAFRHAA